MIILGILSFCQLTFLPGLALLRLLRIPVHSFIQGAAYAFAFSLLTNYLLVFALTALHTYTRLAVFLYLGITLLYFLTIWVRGGCRMYSELPLGTWKNGITRLWRESTVVQRCLLAGCVWLITIYLWIFVRQFGGVFGGWDAVGSWNRWAIDWYRNELPDEMWHYPQLLPANWSLSYQLLGTIDVQCFAKAMMPFFPLATMLLLVDLWRKKRQSAYLLAAIIFSSAVLLLQYRHIADGIADLPVTFGGFLAFYALLIHKPPATGVTPESILVPLLFASFASVIKQAGLFILIAILIVVIGRIAYARGMTLSRKGAWFAAGMGIILMTVVSWYLMQEIRITRGLDTSEVKIVTQDIYQGKGHLVRIREFVTINLNNELIGPRPLVTAPTTIITIPLLRDMVKKSRGFRWHVNQVFFPLCGLALIFGVLAGLFAKESRWMTAGISLPYTALFLWYYCYDIRNLSLAFPFLACSASFGLAWIIRSLHRRPYIPMRMPDAKPFTTPLIIQLHIAVIFILLAFSTVLAMTLVDDARLIRRQRDEQLSAAAGPTGMYRHCYQQLSAGKLQGKLVFDELGYIFKLLPGFRDSGCPVIVPVVWSLDTRRLEKLSPNLLVLRKQLCQDPIIYAYIQTHAFTEITTIDGYTLFQR